jgi:hypothetical protein
VIANCVSGEDSFSTFAKSFAATGGKVIQIIEYPVTTADITPKSWLALGHNGSNHQVSSSLGPLQRQEADLPPIGDDAVGVIETTHYPEHLSNAANRALWTAWRQSILKASLFRTWRRWRPMTRWI